MPTKETPNPDRPEHAPKDMPDDIAAYGHDWWTDPKATSSDPQQAEVEEATSPKIKSLKEQSKGSS